MAQAKHRRVILELVSKGRLTEAFDALRAAEAAGHAPGVTVLVRLARALLAEGRQAQALELLERASTLSPFDETIRRVVTEVGQPRRTPTNPWPAADTDPLAPFLGGLSDSSPTIDMPVIPLSDLVTAAVSLPEDDGHLEGEDAATTLRTAPGTVPDAPETPPPRAREPEGREGRQAGALPEEDTTDRVVDRTTAGRDTEIMDLPLAGAEAPDADTAPVPVPETGGAMDDTGRATLPDGSGPVTTGPPDLALVDARPDAAADTDPSARGLEGERGTTVRVALPSSHEEHVPATEGAPDRAWDATRMLDPPADVAAPSPGVARPLPHPDVTATRKLDLDEVAVVGFFEAGAARRPHPAPAAPAPGHSAKSPVDFARVPNSDTLERHLKEEELRRAAKLVEQEEALPTRPTEVPTRVVPPRPGMPRRSRARSLSRIRRAAAGAVAVALLAAAVAYGWVSTRLREEAREVSRARQLLADDTFESHREALATLGRIASRHPGGLACAEHAVEAATMWERFGLGQEHAETARRALRTCDARRGATALALTEAYLLLREGDPAGAEQSARRGLAATPDDPRSRLALALALEASGEHETASLELASARASFPAEVAIALALARVHRRAGRWGEAGLLLAEVARASPRHVEAEIEVLLLGLDQAGDDPPAEVREELEAMAARLETASQGQPPTIVARARLARGRLLLAAGQVDRAGPLLAQARALVRTEPAVALYVARGLRLSGDVRGAVDVATAVVDPAPELRLERAAGLLLAGRPSEALGEVTLLGETDTDRSAQARLEAEARLQMGDALAAVAVVEALLGAAPDSRTLMTLAEIQLARGQGSAAQRILARVSARPLAACAEARRLELRGEPRRALAVLEERGDQAAPCTARVRALLAARLGDALTEITSLRSLLRHDPSFSARLELARAIWRDRGTLAALRELDSVLDAPPTGLVPVLAAIETLATVGGTAELDGLVAGVAEAGAAPGVVAVARARASRLRGRAQAALEALGQNEPDEPALVTVERATALVLLGRHAEAVTALAGAALLEATPEWVEAERLAAAALRDAGNRAEADRRLERSVRACLEAGNQQGAQDLALERVEAAIAAGAHMADLRGLLRVVPAWPPSPRPAFLAGQAAEAQRDHDGARRAYGLALEVDRAHIPSLTRLVELTRSPELQRRLRLLAPASAGAVLLAPGAEAP